jgi:uncharacterized protein (TIGR02996 family)
MTEADFLTVICHAPDDTGPRLAFADWLTDRGRPGDADRADFIRLQCRIHELPPWDGEALAAEPRCADLLRRHRNAWEKPLPPWAHARGRDPLFRRGFVEVVTARAPDLRRDGERLAGVTPLRGFRLDGNPTSGALFAEAGFLRHVAEIGFGRHGLPQFFAALPRAEGLRSLRRLELNVAPPDAAGARALAACPHLAGLESLHSWSNGFGAADVQALASSRHLGRLAELSLFLSGFDQEKAAALAGTPLWGRLRRLQLGRGPLGPVGLRELLRAPAPHLTALSLRGDPIGDEGVEGLAESALLGGLAELDLDRCRLTARGARALAASPRAAGLRALMLGNDALGDGGVAALAASPHLRGLRRLDLRGTVYGDTFGPAGVAALAASPVADGLTSLDLGSNFAIRDDAARALAASPRLASLVVLSLRETKITEAGVAALLDSPHLGRLARLDLPPEAAPPWSRVARRLVERFGAGATP